MERDERERLIPSAGGDAGDQERMLSVMRESPIFQALLNWVDGFIMILDPRRRVVAASDTILEELGVDSEALVGRRPGDVFGCVHAEVAPEGCGTGTACRVCGAMRAILGSSRVDEPLEGMCKLTVKGRAGAAKETRKYRVRATRARADGLDFTVLVFQRSTEGVIHRARAPEELPESLVGYSVVHKLGEGGMGTVYLVRDERGRRFALKVIRPERAASFNHEERFDLESDICLRLDHPRIVRTLGAGQTPEGVLYMVSEFCPNGSAYQYLQTAGPLPVDLAVFWMIEVCRALDYVWTEHGVVHRDIKPDNLLIDDGFHVKLTDFGLALTEEAMALRLTATGTLVGSPSYVSPEQIDGGRRLDVRADLYSLGATFYELLCGSPVFEEPNAARVMLAHLNDAPVPLDLRRPELPPELGGLIQWLLAKAPEDRPEDAAAFAAHLLDYARSLELDVERPPPLIAGGDRRTVRTISPFEPTAVIGFKE